MEELLVFCRSQRIFVMSDETYAEFAPDTENITAIPLTEKFDNLIVLRGVSKFFAAPGLRLGYAVTGNEELKAEFTSKKNPWTVNSLAETAGKIMFADTDYINETRRLISTERERICAGLDGIANLKYYPPYANFILVQHHRRGEKCPGSVRSRNPPGHDGAKLQQLPQSGRELFPILLYENGGQ